MNDHQARAIELLREWDTMSTFYLPSRDSLVAAARDEVALLGGKPVVLDLCGGPGTVGARIASETNARVVVADGDPLLMQIGRWAHGDAVEFCPVSLSDGAWVEAIGKASTDVVITVLALHYFTPDRCAEVLSEIALVLRPSGLLINIEVFGDADPSQAQEATPDPWTQWWEEVGAWDDATVERLRRERATWISGIDPAEFHPDLAHYQDLVTGAGFSNVSVLASAGRAMATRVSRSSTPEALD